MGPASGRIGRLPANVRAVPFVNQPAVPAHASLAAHHGGSGTVLAALDAGVPQLLLPKGADQFLNADALARDDLASDGVLIRVLEASHGGGQHSDAA